MRYLSKHFDTIYGYTGEDTYYVSKWFHETVIYRLQTLSEHVTAIILKITYVGADGKPICPPTVSVVEHLGTISEKVKIHVDP